MTPIFSANSTVDFPSGVVSFKDAIHAYFTRSVSSTPSILIKSLANLFPNVIVPVLSKIIVSTSPHASTAFPDSAITLNLVTRSIPAIPIALSNAPIVVGIKHTVNATNVEIGILTFRYVARGYKVTITIKNIIVKDTNKVFKAISFGVFFLEAPSTIEIILSKNE